MFYKNKGIMTKIISYDFNDISRGGNAPLYNLASTVPPLGLLYKDHGSY